MSDGTMGEREMDRSPAQFFFEIGFGAAFAEALVRNGKAPFEFSDALVEHAWDIAGEAHDDPAEFDRYLEHANAAPRLAQADETAGVVEGDEQQAPETGVCTAQVGTKMFRRADAMGQVRKLIAFGHAAADKLGAEGRSSDFLSVRQKIAGYYEVLTALHAMPVFTNAQTVTVDDATALASGASSNVRA